MKRNRAFSIAIGLLVIVQLGSSQQNPTGARLLGLSDHAVEEQGRIKAIEVIAKVGVDAPGTYRLLFQLQAANGKTINGRTLARLDPGERSISVTFSIKQIANYFEQDGPYRISGARIISGKENAEVVPVDTAREDFVTRPYGVIAAEQERKRQLAATLAALTQEDPPPLSQHASTPPFPVSHGEVDPPLKFSAEVLLRKIHAVLILDRSGSMEQSGNCEIMKAAAIRFSRLFVDGRDSLGVVSFGGTVQEALPITDHFKDASEPISKVKCFESTNTGAAIARARKILAQDADPEAINAVILFTDGMPYGLTANFAPSPPCPESQYGRVAAILGQTNSSLATFSPISSSEADELRQLNSFGNRKPDSCFGMQPLANYGYLPESDIEGIALTGTHALKRFEGGPFSGKIQLDLFDNLRNAMANEVENLMRLLRSDPQNPTFVHVIGFSADSDTKSFPSLDELRQLANDPRSTTFDATQTAGVAVLALQPEEIWPAFLKVRQSIVERATVGKTSIP